MSLKRALAAWEEKRYHARPHTLGEHNFGVFRASSACWMPQGFGMPIPCTLPDSYLPHSLGMRLIPVTQVNIMQGYLIYSISFMGQLCPLLTPGDLTV